MNKGERIMAISFENALGVHPQALSLRERRSEVLAANLANADTPNYKARDLDFQSILKNQIQVFYTFRIKYL
jgi:flagellar basal-body rod protein FlgB